MPERNPKKATRRAFLADGARVAGAVGLGSAIGGLAWHRGQEERYVWQIDPDVCMACGNCETNCVLDESAVKAVQCFALCGYCDVCTGYFPTNQPYVLETGAENQLCPTGAISRQFVEEKAGERFFEYKINQSLCIACGKCAKGCRLMNGSLYMQVRHDRCQDCNECSIAVACPTQAFRRVPADKPNLLGKAAEQAVAAQQRRRAQERAQNVIRASEGDSPIFAARKSGQSPSARKSGQSPSARKSGQSPSSAPDSSAEGAHDA